MGILDTRNSNAIAKPGVEGEGQNKQEPLARITPVKKAVPSQAEMKLPKKRGAVTDEASAEKVAKNLKSRLSGYNPLDEGNGVEQHVGAELDQQQLDKLNADKRRRQALMTQNVDTTKENFTGLLGMIVVVGDRLTGSRLTNETALKRIGSKLASLFSQESSTPTMSERQTEIRTRMAKAIEGMTQASKEAQSTVKDIRGRATAIERLEAGGVAAALYPQTRAVAGPSFPELRRAAGMRGLDRLAAEIA